MKRKLVFVLLFFLGSAITAIVDSLSGVSFKEVGVIVNIMHKVMYMAWGIIFTRLLMWSKIV
jgi:hypothetical protein